MELIVNGSKDQLLFVTKSNEGLNNVGIKLLFLVFLKARESKIKIIHRYSN